MKKSNKINIPKEKRSDMISEIQRYFENEREEELGDLAAGLLVDFIIEKLGPEFYNQGVFDSYVYMTDRVEDLLGIQK